jgi:hypothetical protein
MPMGSMLYFQRLYPSSYLPMLMISWSFSPALQSGYTWNLFWRLIIVQATQRSTFRRQSFSLWLATTNRTGGLSCSRYIADGTTVEVPKFDIFGIPGIPCPTATWPLLWQDVREDSKTCKNVINPQLVYLGQKPDSQHSTLVAAMACSASHYSS